MAVATSGSRAPAGMVPDEPIAGQRQTPPVKIWAGFGAVAIVLIAWVLIDWISGPYFRSVPQGPSEPTSLMSALLLFWQVFTIPAAIFFWWRFIIRPWRREGSVGPDGILVMGFSLMWFQDPLSSTVNHWFVYNTAMVNMGSWVHSVPWFTAPGSPGAMTSEPLLFTPAAYTLAMGVAMLVGTAAMRWGKKRWPNITTFGLVAWCFFCMCAFDVLLEGIVWLPMGVFEYPGGHWSLFPSTYHKYPLNEMFTIASVFTALATVRYFTNDKGQMVIERGVDKVSGSKTRKLALRGLAAVAFCQLVMFLGYNVPNTLIGANSTAWPKDLQKRSYFTNFICGQDSGPPGPVDRPCPGPGNPNERNGSAYVGSDGSVVTPSADATPAGHPLPQIVPFDVGKPGGGQ